MYHIYSIPTDAWTAGMYHSVLAIAVQQASQFIIIVRTPLSQRGTEMIKSLDNYLLISHTTREWPGTSSSTEVLLKKYRLHAVSASLLARAETIWDWLNPEMPEDLSFLRADGTPWFVSITHERDAYFKLSESERSFVAKAIEPIPLHRDSSDAVPEERY
jgi:hypothetical protein